MTEPLTLAPGEYGTIGAVMCGVTYQGQVSVAGDIAQLDDGGAVEFARGGLRVCREGDSYSFAKLEG